MKKYRLRPLEELQKNGFVHTIYGTGEICLSNGERFYKIVNKSWFDAEIEVMETPKKTLTEIEAKEMENMLEEVPTKKVCLNEIVQDERKRQPIND